MGRASTMLALAAIAAACEPEPHPAVQAEPAAPAEQAPSVRTIVVHPDVYQVPRQVVDTSWVVRGACPGEYCAFGEWTLSRAVTLRAEPDLRADSVGFVAALQPVCADSGLVVVDPTGVLVINQPSPEIPSTSYPPDFALGDTIIVLDYQSENIWNVIRRDTIVPVDGYWADGRDTTVTRVRAVANYWWVHLTDRATGERGWILRTKWAGTYFGWHLVDGGQQANADWPTPPCG